MGEVIRIQRKGTGNCPPATILDSDGVSTFEVDSGGNGACTLALKSGIAFCRAQLTGATVSHDDFDDYWHVLNEPYPADPTNPTHTASLLDFFTLNENNAHGNKFRYVDENGLQVFGNGLVYDHYRGNILSLVEQSDGLIWSLKLASAKTLVINGISGFRMPNIKEESTLHNSGLIPSQGSTLNYFPFNIVNFGAHVTSTTRPDVVTNVLRFEPFFGGGIGLDLKTTTSRVYIAFKPF